jgi:hypothetical protein
MKTQTGKSRSLPLLVVGIAVVLFSTAGIAAIMGWLPASTDRSGGVLALDNLPMASAQPVAVTAQTMPEQVEGTVRTRARCAECGVIVSVREIEGREEVSDPEASETVTAGTPDDVGVKSTRSHEITVRLADGSNRVIHDTNPAGWRSGERVIFIDGANPPNR